MSFFGTMIICAVVCGVVSAVCLLVYAQEDSGICFFIGTLSALVALIMFIVIPILAFDWHASEYKAKIVNREYGTSYTREEIFFASDIIDTIREINRTRIEANGNLLNCENITEAPE